MSRNKTAKLKAMLGKKIKQNRRVPLFAIAKTNRRITQNIARRNWRRNRLKLRE